MRIGELSTIFNLGSEKVYYSKHVWYACIGLENGLYANDLFI